MSHDQLAAALAERYHFERELGRGGMAVVYLARDVKHGRRVAIKVLHEEFSATHTAERFFREIEIAARLAHPNILPLHDSGRAAGHLFYVTPFVEGESLRAWLQREQKLPLATAVRLASEVADALDYAHRQGVVHRDIKPANILIADGHAVVADFGIATALGADPAERLTHSGFVVGTPGYMSPEQSMASGVDARSDIYSLSCVLYEMLTGQPPAPGTDVARQLQGARPAVPRHVAMAIERGVAPLQDQRHSSAREFREAILATPAQRPRIAFAVMAMLAATALAVAGLMRRSSSAEPARLVYEQLTNFANSATSPTISPDGRTLAFIRGESSFFGPGDIYVKSLPDGEPVQITNDSLFKMAPKFTPDGASISYTTLEGSRWRTWIVPVLGGPARVLMDNAAAVTWIADDPRPRILFSEMTGLSQQMAIVTATQTGEQKRVVYMPPESGMAHRSYLSPDKQHVLLIEMDFGTWLPCRVVPFDGSAKGKQVGPKPAQCTDAAWSPDAKWIYVAANTGGGSHIWRQRFPEGEPEQLTFGATDEDGIDVAADGRSFVTSIGNSQSTLWVHDARGDREVTSQGYALLPSISPDGKKLYYLLRSGGAQNFVSGQLWVVDLASGERRQLLRDFLIRHYSLSRDGQRIVFSAADSAGGSPLWLARLDGGGVPRRLTATNVWSAYFAADGEILFLGADRVYRIREDGTGLQVAVDAPVPFLESVSNDGKWAVGWGWRPEHINALLAYPTGGGAPTLICDPCNQVGTFERGPQPPIARWSADGTILFLYLEGSTYAIPLQPGEVWPAIPKGGFTRSNVERLPGVKVVGAAAFAGSNPSVYAFTKFATQRNIYRVSVP